MSTDKAPDQTANVSDSSPLARRSLLIVLLGVACLIIIILIVVVLRLLNTDTSVSISSNSPELSHEVIERDMVITPENINEVIAQMPEEEFIPIGAYEVQMNTEWTFEDGTSASTDAYVANSIRNTHMVNFTIRLDGTEDVIYTSPYLSLGSHIENITLDKELSAGVYNAILTYHLVDESFEEVSTVSVSITITIKH